MRHRTLLVTLLWTLAACAPPPPLTVTVEVTGPVRIVTATPTPEPVPPKALVVCLPEEPGSLYLYGGSAVAHHVLEAIYDGPIDHRAYSFQPVILEKLPSLADGDALLERVTVEPGELVVDVDDRVVPWGEDVTVEDADGEPVTFDGNPVTLERMVVMFRLREGITWSDGEPLTAHDSVYSFNLVLDPDTLAADRYAAERTASFEATDDRTLVWTGLPGYRDPLYFTNFWSPLPYHQLWRFTAAELMQVEESARRPLGWGSFVIDEWVAGDHIALSRNPRYFRAVEGLPHLDRLIFKFASGVEESLVMLLTGECDVAVRGAGDPDFGARTPFVVRAHEQGLLQAAYTASARWVHLDFGINPGPDYDRPDFFEDARVRQALAQCIDREAIASALSYGRGAAVHSFVPPGHLLYADDGLSLWPHNPRAADRLLSEVGWRDEDHDGWLEAHDVEGIRDEQPFAVTLRAPEGYELLAQMIQADLMDCGIRVEVETLPSEELLTPGPESPLFGRQFDLAVFAWQLSEEPHCQLYASGEIPTDENGWVAANISGYSDPGYDEVCGAARQSLPGLPEYDEHHRQAQVLFSEALPAIPLFLELEIAAARPEVRNLILDPTEEGEMWNVELFDIEER